MHTSAISPRFMADFLTPIRGMSSPPRMAYAMTWTNRNGSYWVPSSKQTAYTGFHAFYQSDATLFADDLPDLTAVHY